MVYGVYISKSCQSRVPKNKLSFKAVAVKLFVEWLSREFRNFQRLEKVVARRVLLKNVARAISVMRPKAVLSKILM